MATSRRRHVTPASVPVQGDQPRWHQLPRFRQVVGSLPCPISQLLAHALRRNGTSTRSDHSPSPKPTSEQERPYLIGLKRLTGRRACHNIHACHSATSSATAPVWVCKAVTLDRHRPVAIASRMLRTSFESRSHRRLPGASPGSCSRRRGRHIPKVVAVVSTAARADRPRPAPAAPFRRSAPGRLGLRSTVTS